MIAPSSRRRSWPDISPCNSTTANNNVTSINDNDPQQLTSNKRDSLDSCTPWSLSSFKGNIPSSPSPNCSSFTPSSSSPLSPLSDFFYSQISPSVFSTPPNKRSPSSSDKEEVEEEGDFQPFFTQKNIDSKDGKEEVNPTSTQRLSYSTEYKSVFDAGLLPLQLPEVAVNEAQEEEKGEQEEEKRYNGVSSSSYKEEETVRRRSSIEEEEETVRRRSSIEEEMGKWPPVDAHHELMIRPRPYGSFLEEIKKREFEEEVDAWKEDQNLKLMDKLKKKEDAIHKWELKETRIATMRMKKLECKWERKRAKALKQLQKKIGYVQRKAEEKKVKERRSTVDELSRVFKAAENMKATRTRSHLKFFCIF